MKLPITSWNRTLRTLGYKVVRQQKQKRKKESQQGQVQYDTLEPRQMLAGDTGLVVQADLDQLFATADDPLIARTGLFDANASYDVAILSSSGQLTVATNGDNGTWQSRQTVDLGVGPLHGMELALVNDDAFSDLILQGPDSIFVALNDGAGNFSVTQTLTPLAAGQLASGTNDSLQMATGDFNGDFVFDVAAIAPGADSVVIYLGVGDGTFGGAIVESTGGVDPTSIVAGDFIGNGYPDLAIGHSDGSITFLQNTDGTAFVNRNDLTVTGFNSINDLATADIGEDGDLDIVVASGEQVTILNNEMSQLATGPAISNGTFGVGLNTWNVEVVGETSGTAAGSVIAQSGFAQLVENESFITSLNQDFVIPDAPQQITVDLLEIGLEDPNGGIPDAFEISILDADGNSLVPTFRPDATSFFNVNPGDVFETASGVTFDGTTVTVDISAIPAGTDATIYFDLIGNGPGNGSTVTIDNVLITPDGAFDSSFSNTTLQGPFTNANDVIVDDVDGDSRLDVVVSDGGTDTVVVFNGQADGTFEREEIDLSGIGSGLVSLDTAPLTAGDSTSDIVVVANASDLLISPLSGDTTAPTATLQSPVADTTNTGTVEQIDIVFDEPMRDLGPTDSMSVTNPANYTVTFLGADGIAGTADDVTLGITGVNYEPLTGVVTLDIDPASTPLEDGVYVVTLDSNNLKDVSDNPLADGANVEFEFTMNSVGPVIDPFGPLTSVEGDVVTLMANFTDNGGAIPYNAIIDWGDGSETSANMIDFQSGNGTITASHIYADDGDYDITLTVQDDNGVATQAFTEATVINADPVVTPNGNVNSVLRGQSFTLLVADFIDAGFDNVNTGSMESFTANITWGDGTSSTGSVTSTTGMPGSPSSGSVDGTHTYVTAGTFTVTVTVTDDDGGTDSATFEITVDDDAPEVSPAGTITGNEGSSATLNTTFTDQGDTTGSYTATVFWGDGSSSPATATYANGSGSINATHTYADNGSYTVTLELTDPDNNTVSNGATANISNVGPTVTATDNQSAATGTPINLNVGTFSDPGFTNTAAGTVETFTTSVDWGDGSSSTPTPTVVQGSEGALTTGSIDATHTYTAPGTYEVAVTVTDDDNLSSTDTFEIIVTQSDVGVWLPAINFELDADGNAIGTGEVIAEQWAAWGVHITTDDPASHPAMIFDSANPTGGDNDLASSTLGNILIISEDGDSSDPDDNASGGTLIFNFDTPVMLDDIGLLDIEASETVTLRTFDASGNALGTLVVNGAGNNAEQLVALSALGVSTLEVEMSGSGAVTDLIFCRDVGPNSVAGISGPSTINEGADYPLTLEYNGSSLDYWVINWGDGTVDTVNAGDVPTHAYADGEEYATITAVAYDTDGNVYQANFVDVEINNVAPTITIDGDTTIEEGETYTIDLSSTDPGDDTITHWIIDWGDGSGPQVIEGDPETATHVYDQSGDYTIKAQAFDEDSTEGLSGSELGILARGNEGGEQFNLIIDGQVVQTYTTTTEFQRFTYSANQQLVASDVRIEFINDLYDPANGIDYNLQVDCIDIDARVYETEANDVWSTATWKPADGITPGFRTSEWLHANGYFQFDSVDGTEIEILALGQEGGEEFNLLIDDVVVESFVTTTEYQTFTHSSATTVAANQIKIEFTNDLWDPDNGVDRNLYVDNIKLDGNVYETEAPSTYSTGTWLAEDGTVPGYRNADYLSSNGYLHYDALPGELTLDPYCSNELTVTVTQPAGVWLPNIDFEFDAAGVGLQSGDVITDQFASMGVHITTDDPTNHPAMIFDSAHPTGEDYDLGTPSQLYGGPGVGEYGEYGESNTQALNNVLIISEDANSHDPDDNYDGGTMIFTFDEATMIDEIGFLDINEAGVTIRLYDSANNLILNQYQTPAGENEVQRAVLNATGVSKMEIEFDGLGAVTDIEFCRDGGHLEGAPTKFVTVDRYTNSAYRYDEYGNQIDGFGILHNAVTQGVATTPQGDPIWVLKSNEWVYVYSGDDNAYQGRWDAHGPIRGKGIASDGADVWIVDSYYDKVYFYAGGADHTGGQHSATSSFSLNYYNYNPQGITVHGDKLWVTDTSSDKVFVYSTSGDFLGKWSLDSANGRSSGITTDPSGENLWVTDYSDGVIYYYAGAGSRLSGSQNATSIIQLPANNQHPEGIADPVSSINFGDVVTDTIANAGEVNDYQFNVTAGTTKMLFDITSLSGGRFQRQLIRPDGTVQTTYASSNPDFIDADFNLDQVGTYTFRITGPDNNTPSYSFSIYDTTNPIQSTINLGDVITDSVATPGDNFAYDFNATAGQQVFFDFQALSGGSAINLTAPDGTVVLTDSATTGVPNNLDNGPLELLQSGTYTFTVDPPKDNVPSFQFQIVDVPNNPPVVLNLNDVITNTLSAQGEVVWYDYVSDGTEEVFFDFLTHTGGKLFINFYDPTGAEVFNDNTTNDATRLDNGPFELTIPGTYQFRVDGSGDDLPSYSFEFVETQDSTTTIALGDSVSGEIVAAGTTDSYEFASTGTETIYFNMTGYGGSNTDRLNARLTSPSGAVLFTDVSNSGNGLDNGTFDLTEVGNYKIEIWGDGDAKMTYGFDLVNVAPPTPEAIALDQAATGDITVGDTDVFELTITQPELAYLNWTNLGGVSIFERIDITLTAPDGSVLLTDSATGTRANDLDNGVLDLDQAGTYQLTVSGRGASQFTSYGFTFIGVEPTSTQTIELDELVTGDITIGNTDIYELTTTQPELVFINFTDLDGISIFERLNFTLIAPDGSTVLTDSATGTRFNDLDNGAFTLDQVGTYQFVLTGSAASQFTKYDFTFVSVPDPEIINVVYDQRYLGSTTVPGETDVYVMTANAGDVIFFDLHRVDAQNQFDDTTNFQLFAPDGTLVFNTTASTNTNAEDRLLTFDQTGDYELIVRGVGDRSSEFEFTAWFVDPDLPIPVVLDQVIEDIRVPSQTMTYELNADSGDDLVFAITRNTDNATLFTLTAPSGAVIFQDRTSGFAIPTLTETGTYTLTLETSDPANSDLHGTFGFKFLEPITPGAPSGQIDSQGTEFWLGFPSNIIVSDDEPAFELHITSAVDTTVMIEMPGIDDIRVADITAGEITIVPLPDNAEVESYGEATQGKGIHVYSANDISVYAVSQQAFTTDAYLGLPVEALGTDYITLNYPNYGRFIPFGGGTAFNGSQFAVVAQTDNTVLTITPADDFDNHPAGVPYNVTINAGEVYQLANEIEFATATGTIISSTEPVAVISGHRCPEIPEGVAACDYVVEQLPPVKAWGTQFATVPLAERTGGDSFRFVASVDNTSLQINGTTVATLNRGEWHEQIIDGAARIESNNPILMAQFANGQDFDGTLADPFMMLVTPIEQYQVSYTISTLDDETFTTGHFINIVASSAALQSLTIDGAPVEQTLFTAINGSSLLGAQIPIPEGSYNLASNLPFGVSVYGFGFYESYGYPGGNSIAPIAEIDSISTTPDTATVQIGGSHTVTTTVLDDAGQPLEGILVNYSVTGANSGSGFGITDAAGMTTFTYTATTSGADSIVSFVGGLSDIDSVNWLGVEPTVTISDPVPGEQFQNGQSIVLSGRALPGAPDAEIVSVTINGQLVDALDNSGNYFGLVNVSNGLQSVEVIATDVFGNTATASIQIEGLPTPPVDPSVLSAVDKDDVEFTYTSTSFNRATNKLCVDYTITNNGSATIGEGALAVFDGMPVSVTVDNPDGTSAGADYFVLDAELPAGGLQTGQTTSPEHLVISNQNRARFDWSAFVLAAENLAPEFNSTPEVVASVDSGYQYVASATDPNGHAITYSLVAAPAGMSVDSATGLISWTPVAGDVAQHDIQVSADDGQGGVAIQSYSLSVTDAVPGNRAPVFTSATSDALNMRGLGGSTNYQFQAGALDPDNDTITFSLAGQPGGMTIDGATGTIDWAVTDGDLGSFTFDILADDGAGNVATQSFTLTVIDQDTATVSGFVFEDTNNDGALTTGETGMPGRTVFLDANSNGQVDTGEQTQLTDASGNFTFTGLIAGSYTVGQVLETGFTQTLPVAGGVTVLVGAGGAAAVEFGNFDNGNTANSAPVITSTATNNAKVNNEYQYQLSATDADGDDLNFALLNAPDGMTIDSDTGLIGWTPTADQQTINSALVQVDDGNGNVDVQAFDVLVRPEFQAPSITSDPNLIATVDEAYEYLVTAEDPDMQMLTYDLVSGPAGATIDAITGLISWTPTNADLGTAQFEVTATDIDGLVAAQTFDVSVRDVNVAPVFTSDPVLEATAGERYAYFAVATDTEDSVSYSLVQSPAGMVINSTTGVVSWTAGSAEVGSNVDVTVRATDERGLSTDQTYTVAVAADTEAPVVVILSTNNVIEPGDSITYQVNSADNVAVDTVNVTFDGTPVSLDILNQASFTAATPGIYVISATATDTSGNTTTTEKRIRVIDPADMTAPTVEITSPTITSQITYLTDVTGTVTSSGDIDLWRLEYSLRGTDNWVELATGTTDLSNEFIATFDPTLLANDLYDIRLYAQDFSGNFATTEIYIGVEGQAKIGNYAIDFTDLTVPLAGIPIQIIRSYDTLDAPYVGDFGYGWNLSIGEARIRETVPVTQAELDGVPPLFGGADAFFPGSRVYMNTPDGQRVGFTFDPQPDTFGLLGAVWSPKFVADVDTDWELEVPDLALGPNPDGTFGLYLIGGNYNPTEYTLVSKDQVRYTYDQFDELQTVTDRNDVTLEYRDDGIFSSTGESIQFVRDSLGRITEIIDPLGNVIEYEYDADGDLISHSSPADCGCAGGSTLLESTMTYNDENPHFLETITGPRGNLINEVKYDEDGRFVGLVDALGNEVVQQFDVENNTFVQTDRNGNPTTLVYDDRGNVTLETDALGNDRIYEYSDSRHAHLETSITNERGFETQYEYDDAGNIILMTEPGRLTRFEYDSFNNVTKEIGPFATLADEATARVTEYKYDSNGNLSETIDAFGNSSFQTVDSFGRSTSLTDRRGNTTTLDYSQLIGSPTLITNPDLTTQEFTYDDLGRILIQTNELGVVVQTITYDASGRRLSVAGADGQLTMYEYDEDLLLSETVKISATENQVTTYEYDANNRLFRQTDGIGAVVELTYDANGNVLSLKDPVDNTTSYIFDALDRQIEETDPLGNITTYAYDENGNLIEKVDRLDRRIEFVYDALDRQSNELWYAVDGTLVETSTYSYDIFDNLLAASDNESSFTYTYDVLDRLLNSDNAGTPDAPNVILSYTYDVDGNRIRVEDNSGVTIDSEYGNRNQLLSKTWFGGEVDDARVEYSYDDELRETETRRFSDTSGTNQIGSTETAYDDTGRRIRITHLDSSNVVLANYEYEFDNANRITQQVIDNDTVDYTYDATEQLLTADHSDPSIPDEFYVYDLNGNRIESHLHGSDYVTGPNNQLLSDGEFNYQYDDEGNQIRRTNIATGEVAEFEYDHRNRLVRTTVKTSGGIITSESQFVFDVFGRRIAVINDADGAGPNAAVRENFVYDGDNVWADYNEIGEATARYLFGDSVDSNIARWRTGEGTGWYLTDHLRTIRAVVDANGILINQTIYDSFGQVLAETNSSFSDRFKFTGRESSSGPDYYFRARIYDANQGRFTSLDPIGFEGQEANLFAFGNNSPLLFSDPSGTVAVNEASVKLNRGTAIANTVRCGAFSLLIGAGLFFSDTKLGLKGSIGGESAAATAIFGAGTFFVLCSARGIGQAVTIRQPLQVAKVRPPGGFDRLLFELGRSFGRTVLG